MAQVASTVIEPGTTVAGYRIQRTIGRGGMGVVYEATQLSLHRQVALKVIAAHLGDDPQFLDRFRREGLRQAAVEHPAIVTVYEAGECEAGLFLAMQLVRGVDLKHLIAGGELAAGRAVRLLARIADALDAAHGAGLVHRDIKPRNILVDAGDRAYLADFGLTRANGDESLTGSGLYVGTPAYISPEQINGDAPTSRADTYALAAVLYECLAGEPPFVRESHGATLAAHLFDPVPSLSERRPDLPRGLDAVVARGMAKKPAKRYATAGALVGEAAALLDAAAERDLAFTRAVPVPHLSASRRAPLAWTLAVAVVVGLAVAGTLLGRASVSTDRSIVEAGAVRIAYPHEWQPVSPPPNVPGVEFTDAVALRSGRAVLVAGTVVSVEPAWARRGGRPVDVAGFAAVRRAGSWTVDVIPTNAGAAAIACRGVVEACERIEADVSFRGAHPYALRDLIASARVLKTTLAELSASRAVDRTRLRAAATPRLRAAVATATHLAADFRAAGNQLRSEPLVPRAVIGALDRTAAAYAALATAARRQDRSAYAIARRTIIARESDLARRIGALRDSGYTVPA